MGSREEMDELPELEFLTVPEGHTFVSKRLHECHWSQAQEADIDSSHVTFLHEGVFQDRLAKPHSAPTARWMLDDRSPRIHVEVTPYGYVLG
jgi:phthalate 4,5-dioxygenase oxygenase subunit